MLGADDQRTLEYELNSKEWVYDKQNIFIYQFKYCYKNLPNQNIIVGPR